MIWAETQHTYPPTVPPCSHTHTCTVPPSTPTAFTGTTSDVPAMAGGAVVLALIGAVALRIATKHKA